MSTERFHTGDYVVFAATLVLSAATGLYHSRFWHKWKKSNQTPCKEEQTKTNESSETDEFLMGGRNLPVLPVALSLMTTFVSGFSLLGVPAEIYQRGLLMWTYQMMGAPALLICLWLFLPLFYRLRPTSIYSYFEQRFGSLGLRRLAAGLFLVNTLFYMAVVIYSPAVALAGATGVPTWPFILSVGVVCTFYTSLGGLRGVVWTDALQAIFMYGGIITLLVKGTVDVGGVSEVFRIANESRRVEPLSYIDPNPAQYFSLWIALFGGISFWMSLYGLNQMAVQRYCSLKSIDDAKKVVYITIPAFLVIIFLCCYLGLVMLAAFWDCDPLSSGDVTTKDQLVILFVLRTFRDLEGLPGLFLACLFSGTLSSVSSGINSMAAVTWEDFIKNSRFGVGVGDARAALLNKGLVAVFGAVSMGLAFLVGPSGGILKAGISMIGALAGPLVGLFFLGVLVPKATRQGAIAGAVVSMGLVLWITLGNFITKPYDGYNLGFPSCPNSTASFMNGTGLHYGNPSVAFPYRISNYFFAFIGIFIFMVVSVPTSFAWRMLRLSAGECAALDARARRFTILSKDSDFQVPLALSTLPLAATDTSMELKPI